MEAGYGAGLNEPGRRIDRYAGVLRLAYPLQRLGSAIVKVQRGPGQRQNLGQRQRHLIQDLRAGSCAENLFAQVVDDAQLLALAARANLAAPPLTTRVIQLKFAAPTNILAAVQNSLTDKRSKVVADVRTSQLVVLATEQEQVDVDMLVDRLDTQTKQVLIEARLLEMTINPTTSKGIDWSGTLAAQNFSFGNGVMSGRSTTTIPGTPSTTTLPSGKTQTTTPGST